MTTLREHLKQRLDNDYLKIEKGVLPQKIWNSKDQEMIWNNKRKVYVGKNNLNQEITASIQNSSIEFFWFKCTNLTRKGNIEIQCGELCVVPITNDKPVKCNKCEKTFETVFNIDPTVKAFETFNNLDKEV